MTTALVGAIVLGVLSTFYDFLWAHFEVRHKAVNGLVHGMTLLSVAGLVLAWPTRRWLAGLAGRCATGFDRRRFVLRRLSDARLSRGHGRRMDGDVARFSALARLLRRESVGTATAIRGIAAAALSGVAFYLVSGMWTDHSTPPNYLRNLASWTFAFFPGFAALLWRRGS